MITPVSDSPFAVLTLIAAPAVFTNASSVLALGTGNRLARVVDRTQTLVRELHGTEADKPTKELWVRHLGRLEQRGALLVRFDANIGVILPDGPLSGARICTSARYWLHDPRAAGR